MDEKVLILGSKGMLGGQLMEVFNEPVGWDKEDVDVTDFESLKQKILVLPDTPKAIINCVAYNDVDGAEENSGAAFALNAEFVGKLAEFCKQLDTVLVHFSTNYVFDGEKGEYGETDTPSPISVYGLSKYQGEQLVQQHASKCYLVRTAVLFGPNGESVHSKKSFIDLMLELAEKQTEIKAVNDEVNSITLVTDLAQAVKYLVNENKDFGIYHITNQGQASWYDIAKDMFFFLGKKITLLPVPATEFPRKAKRPKKAVLLNTKMYQLQTWPNALREYLVKVRAKG
jgi:dTDP-4-dehydrorhamnose reductase